MARSLLKLLICLAAAANFISAQSQHPLLTQVQFIDHAHGWVLAQTAKNVFMVKTIDAGKHWKWRELAPTIIKFRFFDAKVGWAVGARGTILHTTDGGESWKVQASTNAETLYDVFIIDPTHVWISGRSGTMLETTDGGSNWTTHLISDAALPGTAFTSEKDGYAVGYDAVYSTKDGGTRWSSHRTGDWKELLSVAFISKDFGWITVNGSGFLRTTDGGSTWSQVVVPGTGRLLVSFVGPSRGWAALATGGSTGYLPGSHLPSPHTRILVTRDGGAHWKTIYRLPTRSGKRGWIADMSFIDPKTGFAVGTDGLLLTTTNGGRSWTKRYLTQTRTMENDKSER